MSHEVEIRQTQAARKLQCYSLAGLTLVCLAASLLLPGCDQSDSLDPLEAARQQQDAGDISGSIEPLRELLKTRPDDPEVNFLYGRALALTQGANVASWSLRKAMKHPDWLVPAGSQLAFVALAAGDFNEVVEIVALVLEKDPDNLQVLLMRANAHAHWKKDPELALADANRVLELDPNVVEAYEPRILALLGLERLEEASEALAEAGRKVEEIGGSASVLAWHCSTTAAFQEVSGELEQARATWLECLEKYPADLEVVTSAVAFYDVLGEPERSLEVLRRALVAAPDQRILRVSLADRLRLAGKAAEAEALLREATSAEDPALAAAAWMDLSKLRQALGDYGASAEALEHALELAREAGTPNSQLLFEYADALVLAGRLARALAVAEDLPVPAHQQLIRARVWQDRREPVRALAEYDKALQLWPDNPWARYYAALVAEELGDFERALAEYRYSIRISPEATDARTRGAKLLLAQGNPAAALRILTTGAAGNPPPEMDGQLLFLHLTSMSGEVVRMTEWLATIEAGQPGWVGLALAEAAEGVARRSGPAVALNMLATAPGADYSLPRLAPALRALVRLSHEAGKTAAARAALQPILESQPDSGALQEIHALDLELSGAPTQEVRAAYERALELLPGQPRALAGLGRLTLQDDPKAALAFFDRAAAADPSDPDLQFQAARALIASGQLVQAAQRLDRLLLEHPFEASAASEIVRLDLEREIATQRTLERARRAVRFGGGPDALELLAEVHTQRGEAGPAARTHERARAVREAAESPEN